MILRFTAKSSRTAPESVRFLCKEALKHRLYVSGWMLSAIYQDVGDVEGICVAYLDNIPIASATLYHNNVQCFVRYANRKKGIGKGCVHALMHECGFEAEDVGYGFGIKGSDKFFQKALFGEVFSLAS
jgi:hypothetical protein